MKPFLPLVFALAAATLSPGAIVITEVMSSSGHSGGTNNGDWFELTNTGASAVDITGWSWDDNSFTSGSSGFGALTSIGAGQSVIISEESVGAESSWLSDWGLSGVISVNLGGSGFQGLSSGGDAVAIYDALGTEITRVTFGAAVQGSSFEWDTAGNSLGPSVAGENGAFVAVSNGQTTGLGPGTDIGSPGTAVPEPSAALLAGLAGLGFLVRRRNP